MYLVDVKCVIWNGGKIEYMFPNVGFSTQEISGIVNSQIEIKIILFLVKLFTNLRRYCL
jgi:hypothetical protein